MTTRFEGEADVPSGDPPKDPDVLHGAAVYGITGGGGRFARATGLVTTNFLLWPATGQFEERQVAIVFGP